MFFVVCFSLYLMMETTPGSASLRAVEVGEVSDAELVGTTSFMVVMA